MPIDLIRGDVRILNTLVKYEYDDMALTWTGTDLTQIVYSNNGTTVATVSLIWSGSDLVKISVV